MEAVRLRGTKAALLTNSLKGQQDSVNISTQNL